MKEWESAISEELEFASQFFILETSYLEPTRGYRIYEVPNGTADGHSKRVEVPAEWMSQEHYLAALQHSPEAYGFVEALIQMQNLED